MKIGVFSKFSMAGGSEMRCAEMCNALVSYTPHEAFLLCENGIPDKIQDVIDPKVTVVIKVMHGGDLNKLYEMDHILVVNTDSKNFTTLDYWEGKSDRHKATVDLTRIKAFSFLFNFIVSPARHLHTIEQKCPDVRIITANQRFFHELSYKDKHKKVRHFPRMMLESPIRPDCVTDKKIESSKIRIGKHSHAMGQKFNEEHAELIKQVNKKYQNKVIWDFMGVPKDREKEIEGFPNVIIRKTFTIPVIDYLQGINLFLFYPSWKRQEPWARVVAEALMAGCPVLATDTDGGNRMQVIHGSNGFLCTSMEDFYNKISLLIEDDILREKMSKNAVFYSRFFTAEAVIKKFVQFIS